jgi:hypothetical protein
MAQLANVCLRVFGVTSGPSPARMQAVRNARWTDATLMTLPVRQPAGTHDGYPGAIRSELGKKVRHRTSVYLNNRLEQDHRSIKGRYRPIRGFGSLASAGRFCRGLTSCRRFCESELNVASMCQRIAGG